MPKITSIILPSNFEIVRDQIGAIIYSELDYQNQLTYNPDLIVSVSVERSNTIDSSELQTINVSVAQGTYANKNQGSIDGTYTYNLDFYCNSKTKGLKAGEEISALKLQKLMALVRAILENPVYKTLGFQVPFIMRTLCSEFNIAAPGKDDMKNTAMGRLTFTVTLNETTQYKTPQLIQGYDTHVRLYNTNLGYFYQGENY